MLYKDWLADWLTNYVKPSAKDKTYGRYSDIINHHLLPNLGEYELNDLTPIVVQRFITELTQNGNLRTGKGLSANSVNSIITVIQGSMSTAHLLGFTDVYEMNKLKRPKTKEKQVECFSPTEQKSIEQAVLADRREKMKGIILCLYTGLRIGELLALEWNDIDFTKAEFHVTKTCHDSKNKNGTFCRITDAPKTENSRRNMLMTLVNGKIEIPEITDDIMAGMDYVLSALTEREREVLRQRYMERKTYAAIAESLSVSKSRIQQNEYHAFRAMRYKRNMGFLLYGDEQKPEGRY